MSVLGIVEAGLLTLGCFFTLTGAVGVLRLPDFFTRLHPAAKGDTLGQILVLVALTLHVGWTLAVVKLVLIVLFLLITGPTATHAVARAALLAGLPSGEAPSDAAPAPLQASDEERSP